jgi:hypothetical protein
MLSYIFWRLEEKGKSLSYAFKLNNFYEKVMNEGIRYLFDFVLCYVTKSTI